MAITLVQAGPVVTAATATMSAGSTAGNLLVFCASSPGSSGTNRSLPAGWVRAIGAGGANSLWAEIWYYPNCPAGISSVAIGGSWSTFSAGQLLEFAGAVTSSPLDQTGSNTTGTTSPFNAATSGATSASGELAVAAFGFFYSSSTKVTLTAGTGFTQAGATNQGSKAQNHNGFDYQLATGAAGTITDAEANSATGWSQSGGVIATFLMFTHTDLPLFNNAEGGTAGVIVSAVNAGGTGNNQFDQVL